MIGIGVNIVPFINKVARTVADYVVRITGDAGVSESTECANTILSQLDSKNLFNSASLIISPSGYKGGKAYAEIPTNGNGDLTWTRASDAWRTNADGLIQRVPWNLLQRSEEFDNAAWSKSAATITANSSTSPTGTTTADTLVEDSSNGTHLVVQVFGNTTGVYTLSFYAKPKGRNWIFVSMVSAANYGAFFDIENGVTGTVQSNITSATITSVGNGWYRCTMTSNPNGGLLRCQIYTSTANGVNSYQGDGTSGVYLWGAQLVEGSSAQTYFPTTDRLNVPRLSYMYGSCPALLLEPQRTNLALYSEQLDDAIWGRTSVSVTANQATAPDGTNTMDLLVFSATSGRLTQGISTTSGATYTFSIWLATQSGTQTVEIGNINLGVWQTVTVTSTPTRFSVTQVASSTSRFPGIQSTGAYSILAWGAQLELGAYPTTIIPTTTASATRIADSFSRNNIYTNGLITSSGGTWFVQFEGNLQYTRDAGNSNMFIGDAGNNSPSNSLEIRNGGIANSRLDLGKRISGTFTTLYSTTTSTIKIAFKWNGTSVDVFVNGTKQVSASSFSITNMEFLYSQIQDVPRFIQAMALYPAPLSDTDCTTLTTL